METHEDLEQEIFEAEELDGLIIEKVCITEKFIKLTSKNVNQHISPDDTDVSSPRPPHIGTGKSTAHLTSIDWNIR